MKLSFSCLAVLVVAILATPARHVSPRSGVRFGANSPAAAPRTDQSSLRANSVGLPESRKQQLAINYGTLPLAFEANEGQTDRRVRFLSRGRGYSLFLTAAEAVLALNKVILEPAIGTDKITHAPGSVEPRTAKSEFRAPLFRSPVPRSSVAAANLGMKLVGANAAARITGSEELSSKSNYFIGNDPKKWRINVPNYAKVRYENVYPGVDLLCYGDQGQLEYDFVVAPGADPRAISLAFRGNKKIRVDHKSGDLILVTNAGEVRMKKPTVYQPRDANKAAGQKHVDGRYVLTGRHEVGFEVTRYDRSKSLVIDPVLVYSTYLGSSGFGASTGGASSTGIAVDASGNAYVAGQTASANYPTTAGAYDTTFLQGATAQNPSGTTCTLSAVPSSSFACQDLVVSKLNPTGTGLVYSTFVGGTAENYANGGLAIDPSGNAYVTGWTTSRDFPLVNPLPAPNNAFQGVNYDGFVFRLSANGSALDYSTYLGASDGGCVNGGNVSGQGCTQATGIAVDASGNAYVTGWSESSNFVTTSGAYQTFSGCPGCGTPFIGKLSFTSSPTPALTLAYSTYLGLGGAVANAIALDGSGNVYITGYSYDAAGNHGTPIVNPIPNACAGACATGSPGQYHAYVAKLNPVGHGTADLIYSSYLGGSGEDDGEAIALDPAGNVYVAGATNSTDFPVTPGVVQPSYASSGSTTCPSLTVNASVPCHDAFVTKINAAATVLVYSTYIGGHDFDRALGIAADSLGNAYVVGTTSSGDFPVANPIQTAQETLNQPHIGGDGFVAELNPFATVLVYSTYLGGTSGPTDVAAIAVDTAGNIYIAGGTAAGGQSHPDGNFPVTAGAFQTSCGPPCYTSLGFVSKISPITLSSGGVTFGNQIQETVESQGATTPCNVDPSSCSVLNFRTVQIATTSAPQTVTLNNGSSAPLRISSIALTGLNPTDFAQTSNCPIVPATLAAGASCTINVTFAPLVAGNRAAGLTLTNNVGSLSGAQETVSLIGTGAAPPPTATTVSLTFSPGSNVSQTAAYNCPSGTKPCTDSQAHSMKLTVSQVNSTFTIHVTAFEVSTNEANGDCENGHTDSTDFDCRFTQYFTIQTLPNGDKVVPQCDAYSSGNCVFYRVDASSVPSTAYQGPVYEYVAWNNAAYIPPPTYAANNPRLYDDPNYPPSLQFVADITTYYNPGGGQVGLDPGIGGTTKKFNDFVVAFPAAFPNPPYTFTLSSPTRGFSTFDRDDFIPVIFSLKQGTTVISNAVTSPNAVNIAVLDGHGVRQPLAAPGQPVPVFAYSSYFQVYYLFLPASLYAPGTYTLDINSNLFPQQTGTFTIIAGDHDEHE